MKEYTFWRYVPRETLYRAHFVTAAATAAADDDAAAVDVGVVFIST